MQKPCLIVVAALMLNACAHTGGASQVRIANAIAFELLPPAGFGESLLLTQAAIIEFDSEQRELLFYTEISPARVAIIGTLPNGTRLFNIEYDGQTIVSDGPVELLNRITPEYFLADLQLAQWPLAQVESSLAAANPCFANGMCGINETADQLQRNLTREGQTVISVQYSTVPHYRGSTAYIHHERGYRLQIETLDVAAVGESP